MPLLVALLLLSSLWFPSNPQASIQPKLPEGLWLSDGYGLFVEFNSGELRSYELTSISCILSRTAKRDESRSSGSAAFFASGHAIITIIPTDDPNVLRLEKDGTASDILLRRTSKRPDVCQQPLPNSPQMNYSVFWETFAEHYPFFALHKTDWRAIDKQFRRRVTATTKPAELFQNFRQMIEPLQDTHTGLEAQDIKSEFDGWRDDPYHLDEQNWKKAFSIIESRYILGGLQSYCKARLQSGMLRNSIAYLRITTFYDYADDDGYASELHCLELSLDTIFANADKLKGLVIDVRLNDGGDDPLGIEISSRLTGKKYLAYTKNARNKADLDAPLHFTERQPTWVMPSARPGFKGNVILLIGPDTVSAGETFAMALMGRDPHVTRIGLNTQGVFSDVLNRTLPNGWRFHLPNEIYFTADGQAFDVVGIPPDIRIPFFTSADLQEGTDSALEKSITELSK